MLIQAIYTQACANLAFLLDKVTENREEIIGLFGKMDPDPDYKTGRIR